MKLLKPVTLGLLTLGLTSQLYAQTVTNYWHLSWKDNSDNERGFRIERMAPGETSYKIIATLLPNTTRYVDPFTGLVGSKWCYKVAAFNKVGQAESPEVCATAQVSSSSFLRAPTDVKATKINSSTINVTWVDSNVNYTGTNVYRRLGTNISTEVLLGTVPSGTSYNFTDHTFNPKTLYCYVLKDISPSYISTYSSSACIITP